MSADAELFVCPAVAAGERCRQHDSRGWDSHRCNFDGDHDGAHECCCGHRWADDD